jgi:nucleotide-binding universal stress UspA family protein
LAFRRILVPVDFTPKSRRAARTAARLAAWAGASAVLLHVIERIDDGSPAVLKSFYARLEANARRQLAPMLQEFRRKKVSARVEITYGNRVGEILAAAEREKSDLIVMSSHRLPARPRVESWGTISYKVGLLAHCPVLLVK